MSKFNYKFEKYEFKKFLLDSDVTRFRSEKFIFWVGKIPLPDDLIFRLFEDRGYTLSFYVDHLITLLTLILHPDNKGGGIAALSDYPNPSNPHNIDFEELELTYSKHIKILKGIEQGLSSLLLLDGYQSDFGKITQCLNHAGKKYNRLYLPSELRDVVSLYIPTFDYSSFRAQSDMFGNVVADYLDIYRSGFSDAMSGLFNKLVEFLIAGSQHNKGGYSEAPGKLSLKVLGEDSTVPLVNRELKIIADGSLWEPALIGKEIGYYFDSEGIPALSEDKLSLDGLVLQVLSELELNAFNDKERKKLEYLRKDISRMIKSRAGQFLG